jgi:hypothetical protein
MPDLSVDKRVNSAIPISIVRGELFVALLVLHHTHEALCIWHRRSNNGQFVKEGIVLLIYLRYLIFA